MKTIPEVIRLMYGCDATYLCSQSVLEEHEGEVVWDGEVQIFRLEGHQRADTAYCWHFQNDAGEWHTKVVLHVPPVDSPEAAVRAAIVAEWRDKRGEPDR